MTLEVADVAHQRCPKCGEVVLGFEQARLLQARAVEALRQSQGLMSAEELRGLRRGLGLTQAQLAALLKLGQNSISRWESGRNAQSAAMDLLLRLIRDVPGTLDYLREKAA
jgi:putative zinc finger/helix-turn-helix YgiT family protein